MLAWSTSARRSATGLALLGLLVVSGAGVAEGGDALKARALYQECRKLKEAKRFCKALDACKDGLAEHRTPTIENLIRELKPLCVKPRRCSPGKEKSELTFDHCCWPGQRWSRQREVCSGVPTACPDRYEIDVERRVCTPRPCPEGQKHSGEGYCCWPGQRWSRSREKCIYQPICPLGFKRVKKTCERLPECEAGKDRVEGNGCCWPGQRWSLERERCLGEVLCPEGFSPQGEGCIHVGSPGDSPEGGSEEGGDATPPDDKIPEDKIPEDTTPPDDDDEPDPDDEWDTPETEGDPESTPEGAVVTPPLPACAQGNCTDTDADGVPDLEDACALDPEDIDGVEDSDGCPEHDRDGDGVDDAEDPCPDVSGAGGGCPPPASSPLDEDPANEALEAP